MPIHGSVEEAGLPDVLQLLSLGRKSGCLSVVDGDNQGEIYLDMGRVSFASVANRDRLGEMLVKSGRITRDQLVEATDEQARNSKRKIGRILLDSGHIDRTELERFVRRQVQEAVYTLFTWKQGAFTFSSDLQPTRGALLVSLDAESLLLEGARRVDEWSLIQRKIPSFDLIFQKTRAPRAGAASDDLTEEQRRVLPLLDGTRDVTAIADLADMDEFDVGKALYGLIVAGYTRLVERRSAFRHLEYRELLAYVVREAEFADGERRKLAARHIVDCPACSERLRTIHVRRTEGRPAITEEMVPSSGATTTQATPVVKPAAKPPAAPAVEQRTAPAVERRAAAPAAQASPPPAAPAQPSPAPAPTAAAPRAVHDGRTVPTPIVPSPAHDGHTVPTPIVPGPAHDRRAAPPPNARERRERRADERRAGDDRRQLERRAGLDRRAIDRRHGYDRRQVMIAEWAQINTERRRGDRRAQERRGDTVPARGGVMSQPAVQRLPAPTPAPAPPRRDTVARTSPPMTRVLSRDVAAAAPPPPPPPPQAPEPVAAPEPAQAASSRMSKDIVWLMSPEQATAEMRAARAQPGRRAADNAAPVPSGRRGTDAPPPAPPAPARPSEPMVPPFISAPSREVPMPAAAPRHHRSDGGLVIPRIVIPKRNLAIAAATSGILLLGYVAGSMGSRAPDSGIAQESALTPQSANAAPVPPRSNGNETEAARPAAPERQPTRPAPEPPPAPTRQAPPPRGAAERVSMVQQPPPRETARVQPVSPPPSAPVSAAPQQAASSAPPPTPAPTPAPPPAPPPPAPAPAPAPAGPAPSAAEPDRELSTGGWAPVERAEAATLMGGAIAAIQGLHVESIARSTTGSRPRVRVVQLTPSGDRIILTVTRASAAAGPGAATITALRVMPPSEAYPMSTGTVSMGNLLVTARSTMAAEALRGQLERLGHIQ